MNAFLTKKTLISMTILVVVLIAGFAFAKYSMKNQSASVYLASPLTSPATSNVSVITPRSDGLAVVTTTPTLAPVITPTLCTASSAPWIRITSPSNGTESYARGTNIPVKWKSCNIPANTQLLISMKQVSKNLDMSARIVDANGGVRGSGIVDNTGQATINYSNPNATIPKVKDFTITIYPLVSQGHPLQMVSDTSDAPFTIR